MNKLLRFPRRHEPDVNALSAHLDGRLDARETSRLQAHLASCKACRAQLDGLRATRAALRAMPEAAPPRSFRLRAADVERAAVSDAPGPSPMLPWAPAVSALAVVVFAIVLSVDLTSNGDGARYSADKAPLAAARNADTASSAESGGATDKSIAGAGAPAPPSGAAGSSTAADAGAPAAPTSDTPESQQQLAPALDATQAARAAVGPAPTPTSELNAAGGHPATDDAGNQTTALRVVEIVAGVIAVISAAFGLTLWRRGRERL